MSARLSNVSTIQPSPDYSKRISARAIHAAYRIAVLGPGTAQTLHADWPEPVPIGQWAVANVFIALCDVDASNGGTRLVPGSHREFDRFQAKSPSQRHPNEIVPRLKSGDALVFSGHILHSGTRNTSSRERPLVIVNYQRK